MASAAASTAAANTAGGQPSTPVKHVSDLEFDYDAFDSVQSYVVDISRHAERFRDNCNFFYRALEDSDDSRDNAVRAAREAQREMSFAMARARDESKKLTAAHAALVQQHYDACMSALKSYEKVGLFQQRETNYQSCAMCHVYLKMRPYKYCETCVLIGQAALFGHNAPFDEWCCFRFMRADCQSAQTLVEFCNRDAEFVKIRDAYKENEADISETCDSLRFRNEDGTPLLTALMIVYAFRNGFIAFKDQLITPWERSYISEAVEAYKVSHVYYSMVSDPPTYSCSQLLSAIIHIRRFKGWQVSGLDFPEKLRGVPELEYVPDFPYGQFDDLPKYGPAAV